VVQAYTGFVYGGPGFARTIVGGLNKLLIERGFNSYDEAVGSRIKS
jgi:dihydroorotate dehydrogenase